MIKASELKGRAVIGLEHAQKIGTLAGLLLDPNAAQVPGLKVANAAGQNVVYFPASALYRIGPDAITVREMALGQGGPGLAALERMPDTHALGNTKVVTDGGTYLGTITDIYVDENSLQVLGYELAGQGWENLIGRGKFLQALPGYRYGGDLMLVPDSVAQEVREGRAPAEQQPAPAPEQPAPPAGPVAAPIAPAAPQAYVPPGARPVAPEVPAYSAPTEQVAQVGPAVAGPPPEQVVIQPRTAAGPPATDAYGNPLPGGGAG